MGDYNKALPLYQRSLDIREKMLGPQHPDVAQTLNNLAELYRQMGDYNKALPLYQRALKIVEKKLGQNHPTTTTIKSNYNGLLSEMNEEMKKKDF
jgi:tetratricopeptide (TPR) repeat protein